MTVILLLGTFTIFAGIDTWINRKNPINHKPVQ